MLSVHQLRHLDKFYVAYLPATNCLVIHGVGADGTELVYWPSAGTDTKKACPWLNLKVQGGQVLGLDGFYTFLADLLGMDWQWCGTQNRWAVFNRIK
jgi:hypothetical protein